MTLGSLITTYIAARRSLGASFVGAARTLARFRKELGDVRLDAITTEMCRAFYDRDEPRTRTCEARFNVLRGLFRFAIARRLLLASPLPAKPPRVDHLFRPHIYSVEELRRLLDATATLADARSPLQPATFRTILLLLYAAGLRASEALRLSLADVDLQAGMLRIRESKFSKSRALPISESLCAALRRYRAQRERLTKPHGPASAFFATRTGRRVSLDRLERVFRRVRRIAGLLLPHAPCRAQPRMHDLRHSFAVHRLLAWYRDGADVQQRLPWLSVYMGHRHLRGTQVYLTLTADVLESASARFAQYAQVEGQRCDG